MLWVPRAALVAALLNCVVSSALAENETHWLTDPRTQCAVFDGNAQAGDTVSWSGACTDGLASGQGTASFSRDGAEFESFAADFVKGVAGDGPVVAHWGHGWSYDGNDINGQFNGPGVLINDSHDRFEGSWVDGKMNGQGVMIRADGERYDGAWKDDLPNGKGVLTKADGTKLEGNFRDGTFEEASTGNDAKPVVAKPETPNAFAGISGKTLTGIDGSSIALTLIDGGIQRQITTPGGVSKKTTFTFMNDRMGTVVEDGGPVANVTGFFRLTNDGVEVRYADGRSEILSANADGGVAVTMEDGGDTSCRDWYPDGHVFSDAEKKAALAAYASKLGLQPAAQHGGCPVAAAATPAAPAPHAAAEPKSRAERHAEARPPAAHAAFVTRGKVGGLETVSVKESVVHAIDADVPVMAGPVLASAAPAAPAEDHNASHCLTVESDGHYWGFRNACGFAVQFAYCLMHGPEKMTACDGEGGVNSITGSVAASGFGALNPDQSLSEKDVDHDFRWVACDGGAGEVTAHLVQAEPVSGRCERAAAITASAH